MNKGMRMAMMSRGRNKDDRRDTSRRYENRDGYDSSMRGEYGGGMYGYDRYRDKDGRFAPKPRNEYGGGMEDRYREGGQSQGRTSPRSYINDGVYDAFYDREGRRHYDNGRFAPMRNSYSGGVYDMIGFDTRSDYEKRRERMGFEDPIYHEGYTEEERRKMRERNRHREMGHASLYEDEDGNYIFSGRLGERTMPQHMTRETAEEWTRRMRNEDGTTGPHWSMEQVKQLREQKKELQDFDLADVYAVLNMMYSDYCEVAKKFNVNNMDFYVCMAKAWLNDEDAGAGKAKTAIYYECIAK